VHVIGTTGFSGEEEHSIAAAARECVIVKSGNMSLGVTLLASLVTRAAKALPDFDIEILEMHHRMKADAPSGTALLLAEAAARGRAVALESEAARTGQTGPRKSGTIGFASLRGGTVVGEHQVILAGPHERIVLGHIAEDRAIFAHGAVAAAKWGHSKQPGLYGMADVLGVSE
jgi:4-hydroxy-tetrahydrodipicolinate reductase